ncbi:MULTISPECIES: hypothetical protein [Sphingobium]|uniref:Uncharacterized protein n=1 Tax=Sphingobium indicum (strain DSM 16413 / CCM 7287 / MTCC 6362 / UT26 / NBRC 101211 / UT26S) TaxID=452662 RepID=D4Z5J3_SPHIU|nr:MULTISPECIES: hypothetical protein [Sphingobium]WDA38703.1 hypothetical protein PO876_11270 [Sphingobium sp. YC-XJ3]BAI97875.1 hypothetical protein SJA_C1-30410 [Sphingobium indicum UT26S]
MNQANASNARFFELSTLSVSPTFWSRIVATRSRDNGKGCLERLVSDDVAVDVAIEPA